MDRERLLALELTGLVCSLSLDCYASGTVRQDEAQWAEVGSQVRVCLSAMCGIGCCIRTLWGVPRAGVRASPNRRYRSRRASTESKRRRFVLVWVFMFHVSCVFYIGCCSRLVLVHRQLYHLTGLVCTLRVDCYTSGIVWQVGSDGELFGSQVGLCLFAVFGIECCVRTRAVRLRGRARASPDRWRRTRRASAQLTRRWVAFVWVLLYHVSCVCFTSDVVAGWYLYGCSCLSQSQSQCQPDPPSSQSPGSEVDAPAVCTCMGVGVPCVGCVFYIGRARWYVRTPVASRWRLPPAQMRVRFVPVWEFVCGCGCQIGCYCRWNRRQQTRRPCTGSMRLWFVLVWVLCPMCWVCVLHRILLPAVLLVQVFVLYLRVRSRFVPSAARAPAARRTRVRPPAAPRARPPASARLVAGACVELAADYRVFIKLCICYPFGRSYPFGLSHSHTDKLTPSSTTIASRGV